MAQKCYCGLRYLPDGTCRVGCPPEAKPSVLRAQAAKRRANSRRAHELRGVSRTVHESYSKNIVSAMPERDRVHYIRGGKHSHGIPVRTTAKP
jgi:hypothetical protein